MLVDSDRRMIQELEVRLSERIPRNIEFDASDILLSVSAGSPSPSPLRSSVASRVSKQQAEVESVLTLRHKYKRAKAKLARALMVIESLKSKCNILKNENADLETQNRGLRDRQTESQIEKHRLLRELSDVQDSVLGVGSESVSEERIVALEERCRRAERIVGQFTREKSEDQIDLKLRQAAAQLEKANRKLEEQHSELVQLRKTRTEREEELIESLNLMTQEKERLEEEKESLLLHIEVQNDVRKKMKKEFKRYKSLMRTILARAKAANISVEGGSELLDLLEEVELVKSENEELKEKQRKQERFMQMSSYGDLETGDARSPYHSVDDLVTSLRRENESLREMVLNYRMTRDSTPRRSLMSPTRASGSLSPRGTEFYVPGIY